MILIDPPNTRRRDTLTHAFVTEDALDRWVTACGLRFHTGVFSTGDRPACGKCALKL